MGRKRRISTYQSSALKRTKNIHTRRTRAATIHRDLGKLAGQTHNKRLKK